MKIIVMALASLTVVACADNHSSGVSAQGSQLEELHFVNPSDYFAYVLRINHHNYRKSLQFLQNRIENGDAQAEEIYAKILLYWHRHPGSQGAPPYPLEYAWDIYRNAATKSISAATALIGYYSRGEPGLPRNDKIADCLRDLVVSQVPIRNVSNCFKLN